MTFHTKADAPPPPTPAHTHTHTQAANFVACIKYNPKLWQKYSNLVDLKLVARGWGQLGGAHALISMQQYFSWL